MTEPIAVDVPGKPAFSRSAGLPAAVAPLVEALTAAPKPEPPKPAPPKVEAPPAATPPVAAPKIEVPKAEPPKAEPPKPAAAPALATATSGAVAAAEVAAGVPPVAPAAGVLAKLTARFTRKQLAAGAAVCSLVVGAGGLRLLMPAKDGAGATTPADEKVAINRPVADTKSTATGQKELPRPAVEESKLPPVPGPTLHIEGGGALPPVGGPPASTNGGARFTGSITPAAPTAPPGVHPDARTSTPGFAGPDTGALIPPPPSGVVPTGGALPTMPPALPQPPAGPTGPGAAAPALPTPPAGPSGSIPLPGLPALPGGSPPPTVTPDSKPPAIAPPADLTLPATPTAGGNPSKPSPPLTPDMTGRAGTLPLPKPDGVIPSPAPGVGPTAPGLPAAPPSVTPGGPPALPGPTDVTPKLPALPDTKPPAVGPPLRGPEAVAPKPFDTVPPPANFTPSAVPPAAGPGGSNAGGTNFAPSPAPSGGMGNVGAPGVLPLPDASTPGAKPAPPFDPPGPTFPPAGTPAGFTKPAGATEAKPTAPESAPKTTFDVDVYDPKRDDTYESISQEFYNDKRFAQALRAYNGNQPLQGGRYVNVPPIHVLKRQPGATGSGGGRPAAAPPGDAPNWSATPAARPGAAPVFVVPRGGMTLPQVARQTMGSEQRWRDLRELNPRIAADELIPPGTEVKLPSDARP